MKGTYKPPMIGSFEDIGKDIVHEAAKAPVDIGGKIIESLTGGSSVKGQKSAAPIGDESVVKKPDGALGAMEDTKDLKVKKAIARAALEQLAGAKQPELSDYEKRKQEEQQKKELQKQKELQMSQELPKMSSKKRRGDLYGIKGKSSTEMSKNVRQD